MNEWVDIKWVMKKTKIRSHATLKKRILEPYKDELIAFVKYPKKKGEPWMFEKSRMDNWLRNNVV